MAGDITPVQLLTPVVSTKAFAIGLVYGALGYFATGLVAAVRRSAREGGALAFGAAAFLAVRDVFPHQAAPVGLGLALVMLAVGGFLGARVRPRMWSEWYVTLGRAAVPLLPGAGVLALALPSTVSPALRLGAGIAVVVIGVLVQDFDAVQGPRGAPFSLLALSAVAVYFTVPSTVLPLVMVGCAAPLALLSLPQPLRRLGPAGSVVVSGVFVWVVALGGEARPGSVVAGFATIGLLAVEPLGRRVPLSNVALGRRRSSRTKPPRDAWIAVALVAGLVQIGFGAYCAKIAGRESDAVLSALMTLPAVVLLGAAAPYVLPSAASSGRRSGRGRRRRSRAKHRIAAITGFSGHARRGRM